ncbi:MAG TPA: molybdopterin-dependent oxidoreductase, partial [Vicinamibacteria bacterium]|nr:molybdopterin-dependent oxidoreductase [Vicinamibacteria bacterium]
LALPAVAGKFGKPGGGYALSASEAYAVDGDLLAGAPEAATRLVNMSRLGRVLLGEADPPVRAIFIYDANPAVTLPDQERVRRGLLREDLFTIVFDQVMTDTAAFADVLLPATTFLEHTEVVTSYGTYAVMLAEPVVPPVGEARSNAEVFGELARRLGVEAPPQGDALVARALAAIGRRMAGETGVSGEERLGRLRRERVLRFDFPGESPVQFATVFPGTGDGKAHLWPAELGDDPYRFDPGPPDPAHPLALISPATERSICSTLGEYGFHEAWAEMHPADAGARGLTPGRLVRVHNALGERVVPLRVSEATRPGVVYVPKGTWNRHGRNGRAGVVLVPDEVSPVSGGARFNDARVEVGPA